ESLAEPAIDRGDEVPGFGAAALVAPQPCKAHGGAQFPELGLLRAGDTQRLAIDFRGALGMPLPQQQLAFVSVQLRREPALACPLGGLQSLLEKSECAIGLAARCLGLGL